MRLKTYSSVPSLLVISVLCAFVFESLISCLLILFFFYNCRCDKLYTYWHGLNIWSCVKILSTKCWCLELVPLRVNVVTEIEHSLINETHGLINQTRGRPLILRLWRHQERCSFMNNKAILHQVSQPAHTWILALLAFSKVRNKFLLFISHSVHQSLLQ